MAYLKRNAHKRIEPQKVLPHAKSIIMLTVNYASRPSEDVSVTPPEVSEIHHASRITHHGTIARYARFTDYHNIIGERLKLLTDFVNQLRRQWCSVPLVCGLPDHFSNAI